MGRAGGEPPAKTALKSVLDRLNQLLSELSEAGDDDLLPSVPDTALEAAKHEYRMRRQRETIFGPGMFADPSWDLLLDLFIAEAESRRVSVSSACVAAAVPATTALRHVCHLVDKGLLVRSPHPEDRRCTYISLTGLAKAQMMEYFSQSLARKRGHA
jgi:hypothetical protein